MRHSPFRRPGLSLAVTITVILSACLLLPACSLLPSKKSVQIVVARPPEPVARPPEPVARPPEPATKPTQPTQPTPPALPAPSARPDLSLYRSGQIDPRVRAPSEKIQAAAFRNPATGLKDLTAALVSQEKDPFMKIKLIHDWICVNISYDVAMLKSQFAADQDIEHVMNSRKAVCSGYSRVFQAMAEQAGFSCVTVSGYTKNQSGPRGLTAGNSHAWNIVQINGGRYIVDTTFDAGHVKDWTFIRRYSTDNLFVDPLISLYARYPKQDEQQLVARPISPEEFLNSPDVENAFFSYGLRLPVAGISWKTAAAGVFSFDLELAKPGIAIDAALTGPNGAEVEQGTMIQKLSTNSRRVLVRMPSTGLYTLEVFAKNVEKQRFDYLIPASKFEGTLTPAIGKLLTDGTISEKDSSLFLSAFEKVPSVKAYAFKEDPFDPGRTEKISALLKSAGQATGSLREVLSFQLDNSEASRLQRFPLFYAQYQNAPADSLIEPLSGYLRSGEKVRFSYVSPTTAKVALLANDAIFPMEKGSDGVFRLDLNLPDTDKIKLATSSNGLDYWVAAVWHIIK
ncbi:MAG TPA: transglutaminase domain-containing protein [Rectinemataceae bacterium]|nr:transglutaminase domain-containing protein [Rectinemataceae bacterium]